jgi:RNA polymerase sigma factor (sigma-70 family)
MQIGHMGTGEKIARHAEAGASPNAEGPHGASGASGASEASGVSGASDGERPAALEAALQRRDRGAAIALIDELFGDGLFRFIHAMVRKDDVADDLYQTTLLEAFRDLETFAERSALRTWLFGIARHRCLDALKAGRRRDGRFPGADELPETADPSPSAAERLGQAELLAALGDCLDELVPETRMVLLMRFSEDMPYDDIARVCRASAETLRARVSRALPVLRRCVEQKGQL